MDVTRKNFREILPEFEKTLEDCSFLAIDCEFTGLSEENNIRQYDFPASAYTKMCASSSEYILIQLGVTLFKKLTIEPNKFGYRTYNFYIFPRQWRQSFKCQAPCMIFLAENDFDFNKLFRDGIPYCNQREEEILREKVTERQRERDEIKNNSEYQGNFIPVPSDEQDNLRNISQLIEEFIQSNDNEKLISNCNGFQRKLVYEMIEQKFSKQVIASTGTNEDNMKVIVIKRKTLEDEERFEKQKRKDEQIELEDNIGFSYVIQKISKSKKLIVGHNMMLDIIFILRQFFEPLPSDFEDFKRYVLSIFPSIIDTKYLCSLQCLKEKIVSSVLRHMVDTVCKIPFKLPTIESESSEFACSLEQSKEHQAGYDSYLCGVAFLGILSDIGIPNTHDFASCVVLKKYMNRIFLMKIQDISFINLCGSEPLPPREHVFHVLFPKDWKQSDLINQFKLYGPIHIAWINGTSALIALHHRENSNIVLKTIKSRSGFTIQTYKEFLDMEKKCSSSEDILPKKRKRDVAKTKSDKKLHVNKKTKVIREKGTKIETNLFEECIDWPEKE